MTKQAIKELILPFVASFGTLLIFAIVFAVARETYFYLGIPIPDALDINDLKNLLIKEKP